MTGKELLYVKTVADEKNISKAARKLFIAQPSLSQSIQRIEESVGTPLFKRTSSGLVLTFAGERYYHMAAQILKMYENFEFEISDINNLKTGRIHMGITNHLGSLILPKVLPRFQQLCPNMELHISEENTDSLERMLLANELDFVVMHAPASSLMSQLSYDILTRDRFVIALAKENPLIAKAIPKEGYPYPVLDVKLLKDEPFIMLHPGQRIRQISDSVLEKAGIRQPFIRLTLKNYETAQKLAAQGLGVTMVPLQYSTITSGEWEPVLLCIDEKYGAYWDMCITRLKNGFLSKADELFLRIMKETM